MEKRNPKHLSDLFTGLTKVLPVVFISVIIICAIFVYKTINFDQLASYTANDMILGIVMILFLYAVKSLTVIFPIPVLFITVGTLFSVPVAIAVNIAGLIVSLVLPYGLGRFAGADLHHFIVTKYPKAKKFSALKENHSFFMIYMIRLIGIFSIDLTSMMMGSSKVPFKTYLLGSLLGMLPSVLIASYLGSNVTNPFSPEFAVSILLTVVMLVVSYVLYKKFRVDQEYGDEPHKS